MNKKDKLEEIRNLLMKTLGKDPDKFCYYASLLEAKQLVQNNNSFLPQLNNESLHRVYLKKIIDC